MEFYSNGSVSVIDWKIYKNSIRPIHFFILPLVILRYGVRRGRGSLQKNFQFWWDKSWSSVGGNKGFWFTGKFSEGRARVIFKQICSAVNYMHGRGMIHRDVKAENIFFAWKDHVLLGDFGFATRLEAADQHLTTFCGSPPYAAPELYVVTWTQPTLSRGGGGGGGVTPIQSCLANTNDIWIDKVALSVEVKWKF